MGSVQKAILPRKGVFFFKSFIWTAVFLFVAVGIFAACCEFIENKEYDTLIIVCAVCVTLYAVMLVTVIRSLKNEKRAINKRAEFLSSCGEYLLERLEEEAENTEAYYGTFYLLRDCLFVPKAHLLLEYEDIEKIQNIRHSTNHIKDGVFVEIYDRDGIKYRFRVREWKRYAEETDSFARLINDRSLRGFKKSEREENDKLSLI